MIRITLLGHDIDCVDRLGELLSEHTELEGVINARVVDSKQVQALNKEYAGLDKATDVLSFPYEDAGEELGDIVISRQHVATQAEAAGTSEDTELALLLMHGSLHILGYDHATPAEREVMDDLQSDIMQSLGLKYRNFGWRS